MIVGVTGGIGSGKSTVAALLADRGATVIDADQLARQGVEPGSPALDDLVDRFGPSILRGDGALDRGALADLAFRDPSGTDDLNAIMHPRIAALAAERIAALPSPVIVYDMPLLIESGQADLVDFVVVVDVDPTTQLERALAKGIWTQDDIERRIAAQVDRETRLSFADFVITNDGERTDLDAQVERLWHVLNA